MLYAQGGIWWVCGGVCGLVGWFDLYCCASHPELVLATGPGAPLTHWTQCSDLSLRPDDRRAHFWVFLEKSICCNINGYQKQCILVDNRFNYIFLFGLQEHVFRQVLKDTPFCRWRRWRQKGAFFRIFLKMCSWKSKMENVVKYCVY